MTGQDLKARPLVDRVAERLADLIEPGAGVLVAVSGGADSIALLHLMHRAAAERHLELAVGFVDHGLREETAGEWEAVRLQSADLGLRAERLVIPDEEVERSRNSASIQQWARDARYRELTELARRQGLRYVATGHTRDDQAETVLLRLVRGTGIDGLGGMPVKRELSPGFELVRPLLGISRAEIRDWLEREEIQWVEDPSNEEPRFMRVRVRKEVLPLLDSLQPGVVERLSALAGEARGVSAFLGRYLSEEKLYKNLRLNDGVKVDCQVFEQVPDSLWTRLARAALERSRGDLRRIERAHLEPIIRLIAERGSGGPLPVPGDCEVHVDRGTLFVFPRPLPGRPTGSGQPAAAGAGVWNARFAALGAIAEIRAAGPELIGELEVRARLPGDRILHSERKLKELLGDRRVPRPYRDFVPVLAAGGRVVACPALLPCRQEGVEVSWLLDDQSPFLDIDFPKA
jgi:tRNA(Ile)-lysidine synthase